MKNKNKNRTRASLFQFSEDGKQEYYFMWPYGGVYGMVVFSICQFFGRYFGNLNKNVDIRYSVFQTVKYNF